MSLLNSFIAHSFLIKSLPTNQVATDVRSPKLNANSVNQSTSTDQSLRQTSPTILKPSACLSAALSILASTFLLSAPVNAENRLQLGYGGGYGAHSVQLAHQWTRDWRSLGSGQLGFGLVAEAAVWTFDDDQLAQLSLVPLLEYNFMPNANWQPVVFAGVGPAWISDSQLGTRDLSSEFQFSSRAGLGVIKGRHSMAVEARHLSNGGIKQPNEGISYWNLTYGYRY